MGSFAPVSIAPFSHISILRAWWAWSWESKAVSSTFGALTILATAVMLQPSESTLVARALSSQTRFDMPSITPYVERRETALIVDAIERGKDYIVVDGGNRVGKSVAVEVAASRLSGTRAVRWSVCDEGDTAAVLLRRLFGLEDATATMPRIFAGVAKLPSPLQKKKKKVVDIRRLALSYSAPGRLEPVLVVEMAERLEVKELKTMLDFAKELADKRRGRFIFVFSPTDKLDAIGDFGSLSRATAIHVGDLSDAEATAFLAQTGCAADRALALYALIGGHLPSLIASTTLFYCHGTISLADAEGALFAEIGARAKAVDRVLGAGSACGGLCGVLAETWPNPEVLDLLLKKHLVVAALKKGIFVDSQLVKAYVNIRCGCNK